MLQMKLIKLFREKKSTHAKVIHARGLLSWYKFKNNKLMEFVMRKILWYYIQKEMNERHNKSSQE